MLVMPTWFLSRKKKQQPSHPRFTHTTSDAVSENGWIEPSGKIGNGEAMRIAQSIGTLW
jgi:hypothetical protein